jgi:hypothetical protein
MHEQAEQLKKRSKKFALMLAFIRTLRRTSEAKSISGAYRSATAVAANYRAIVVRDPMSSSHHRSGSRKLTNALWFEITEAGISRGRKHRLLEESDQLSAIFAQSRITALENLRKHGNRSHQEPVITASITRR